MINTLTLSIGAAWLAPIKRISLLAIALVLSACSESSGTSVLTHATANTQVWELSPPQILLDRAVNQDLLNPRVTVNGESVNMVQLGDTPIFRGIVQVPEGEDVELSVEWIEFFRSRELLLAILNRTFESVNSDTNVVLFEDDYETDDVVAFPRLDDDNDRVPNLAERIENSDPLSSLDPGNTRADVFITAISPANAPMIDGSFDAIWGQAQYQDRDRDELSIDNRMVGFDPDRPDQSTEYRFGAMHDGRYLYIFVLGEAAENRRTHGDSLEPWMDDAIDIFWDGDRSQGEVYDGVDDYHIIIPLVKLNSTERNRSHLSDGVTLDPTGRSVTGFNSVAIENLTGVQFANCVCPNEDTYEIRLDLVELGIPLDRSFGFDVQLNNDVDGDEREFKFGWRAPSAGANVEERDETWRNPSLMGLAELVSSAVTADAFVE